MRSFLIGIGLSVLAALPAWANLYTFSTSIDLSSPLVETSFSNDTYVFSFPAAETSFPLAVGDTLSGTITFDQAMTFTNTNNIVTLDPESLMFNLGPSNGQGTDNSATDTIQLLGVSGSLSSSNPSSGTTSGGGLFVFDMGNLEFTSSSVSFTGFSYSLTVTSLNDAGLSYVPENLVVMAAPDDFEVTALPEPGARTLLLGGLAAVSLFGSLQRVSRGARG